MYSITLNEQDGLFWKVIRLLTEIEDKFEIGYSKSINTRILTIIVNDIDDANQIKDFIYEQDTSIDETSIVVKAL